MSACEGNDCCTNCRTTTPPPSETTSYSFVGADSVALRQEQAEAALDRLELLHVERSLNANRKSRQLTMIPPPPRIWRPDSSVYLPPTKATATTVKDKLADAWTLLMDAKDVLTRWERRAAGPRGKMELANMNVRLMSAMMTVDTVLGDMEGNGKKGSK